MGKTLTNIISAVFLAGVLTTPGFSRGLTMTFETKYLRSWLDTIALEYVKDSEDYCPNNEHVKEVESGFDYYQNPSETEKRGKGDCEDMAFYLYKKMKKVGLNPKVIAGEVRDRTRFRLNSSDPSYHVWIELKYNGANIIFDPTCKKFGNWISMHNLGLKYSAFTDEDARESEGIRLLLDDIKKYTKMIDKNIDTESNK